MPTIRDYQETDKDQLRSLIIESSLYQKQQLEQEKIDAEKVKEEMSNFFEKNLKDETWHYIIAEDEGRVIGFVTTEVSTVYIRSGFINDLYVLPEYRKQGVGKQLLEAGLQWLKDRGVMKVTLAVHISNTEAINLYTNAGFKNEPLSYRYLEKEI